MRNAYRSTENMNSIVVQKDRVGEAIAKKLSGFSGCSPNEQMKMIDLAALEAIKVARKEASQVLNALMPFVLEDYYPDCTTIAFRDAVEDAKKFLSLQD